VVDNQDGMGSEEVEALYQGTSLLGTARTTTLRR
jgi:hypothetical protein